MICETDVFFQLLGPICGMDFVVKKGDERAWSTVSPNQVLAGACETGGLFTIQIHRDEPWAWKLEEENQVAEADIVDVVQGSRDL